MSTASVTGARSTSTFVLACRWPFSKDTDVFGANTREKNRILDWQLRGYSVRIGIVGRSIGGICADHTLTTKGRSGNFNGIL